MRKWSQTAGGLFLLLTPLLGGCRGSIVGDWHLVEALPNRDVFSMDRVSFRQDGTFSATTTIEGLTTDEKGTYDFNGFKLCLRPQAGGQRAWPAMLKFDRLEITNGQRRVTLAKGARK